MAPRGSILLFLALSASAASGFPRDRRETPEMEEGMDMLQEVAEMAIQMGKEMTERAERPRLSQEIEQAEGQTLDGQTGTLSRWRRAPQSKEELKGCANWAGSASAVLSLATIYTPNPYTATAAGFAGLIATMCAIAESNTY